MWQTNLIKLYCAVCDNSSTIEATVQRQSNNFRPQFTDEECITVYLWGVSQRRFELKAIYTYTKNHLLDWFPKLPSYQAFSNRVNALAPAFQALAEIWLAALCGEYTAEEQYIIDSCPIILAKGPRSGHGKVATELWQKSYNSSRDEWYYGLKLHAIVSRRPNRLPLPVSLNLSEAAVHDLTAAKQIMQDNYPISDGVLFADKAYVDADWKQLLLEAFNLQLYTPRKKAKGDPIISGDTVSIAVSRVRQPIECFFNWLNRLTNIQNASTVRSLAGLLRHVFAALATALAFLVLF